MHGRIWRLRPDAWGKRPPPRRPCRRDGKKRKINSPSGKKISSQTDVEKNIRARLCTSLENKYI